MQTPTEKTTRTARRLLAPVLALATATTGLIALTTTPAHATVGQTYACAYWVNVNIFGSGYSTQGCAPQTNSGASANTLAPSLTLPAAGGMLSASDTDGAKSIYSGVATFFSSPYDPNDNLTNSGRLDVSVAGSASAVQATAKAETVGPSPFWTRSPSSAAPYAEPAKSGSSYDGSTGFVESKCQGSGSTEVGTVTIKNGFVDTVTGTNGYPTQTVAVPNPTPVNHRINFVMHNEGDSGYIIFNERIANADGTLTVNAVHMYMQGPSAFGDLIIGKTICGIS